MKDMVGVVLLSATDGFGHSLISFLIWVQSQMDIRLNAKTTTAITIRTIVAGLPGKSRAEIRGAMFFTLFTVLQSASVRFASDSISVEEPLELELREECHRKKHLQNRQENILVMS